MNIDSMIKNYNDTMRFFNSDRYDKLKKSTTLKQNTNDEDHFKKLLEHEMSVINSHEVTSGTIDCSV